MTNISLDTHEPSIIYIKVSFLLLAIMQIYNIFVSLIFILTVILHPTFRTIPNLLAANSNFAILIYAFVVIAQLIVGVRLQEEQTQEICIFLSYCTCIAADAVCYSYLVTAMSQYFFNVLYRRRQLLTFRAHWLIILVSWCISSLLPLTVYLLGILQYSPEMHMCALTMSKPWILFVYMSAAIGPPFLGIITIYRHIISQTRRTQTMITVVANSLSMAARDLSVLKHVLTLVTILGTAGFPALVLLIWNAITVNEAPVFLYLASILVISLCTNIQISYIFVMNKNVKEVLLKYIRRVIR